MWWEITRACQCGVFGYSKTSLGATKNTFIFTWVNLNTSKHSIICKRGEKREASIKYIFIYGNTLFLKFFLPFANLETDGCIDRVQPKMSAFSMRVLILWYQNVISNFSQTIFHEISHWKNRCQFSVFELCHQSIKNKSPTDIFKSIYSFGSIGFGVFLKIQISILIAQNISQVWG